MLDGSGSFLGTFPIPAAAANGFHFLTATDGTIGTLFPVLRAVPAQGIDKLAYLTCKGTGRVTALEAPRQAALRGSAGRSLRVLTLVPTDEGCEHPDEGLATATPCPLGSRFYDRLPAAREEASPWAGWTAQAQRQVGAAPRHLPATTTGPGTRALADVLVGDVNHLFDRQRPALGPGAGAGLETRRGWVDEAHNLVERARRMYSAELRHRPDPRCGRRSRRVR